MMEGIGWSCPRCRVSLRPEGQALRCGSCRYHLRSASGYLDAGPPEALTFSGTRRDHLAALETFHFWFPPRDELMRRILRRIAPAARRVIEFGCGTGRFLPALRTVADSVTAVEAHDRSVQAAAARNTGATLLRCDVHAVPIADATFDVAVSLDVLEHVDPRAFLAEALRLVRPGGMILLSVPASPWLWSPADEAAGHRCRYTRSRLGGELNAAGWTLSGHTYYQFLLYPLMAVSRRLFPDRSGIERNPPGWIHALLRRVNAFEVQVLSRWRLPWGSTLIAWARKG